MKTIFKDQSGNILIFILIAVALLGFLTSIVARNSGSSSQAGTVEQNRIKAAAILRFSQGVQSAVEQMRLRGISENDLDFIAIADSYDNPNCTIPECEVFSREGGGLTYETPAALLRDDDHTDTWHVSTANRVEAFGCDDNTVLCTEMLLLAKNIPQSVCLQINKIQGITNPSNDSPRMLDVTEGDEFDGTFSSTINSNLIGGSDATNEAPQVAGKPAGCVYDFGGGQNQYYFYQVLIAR
ncbi:MAG: hypothetical protein GC137_03735 [Alphaproteobacteria bacterium]|nr:hypothetical protein [Alphaproteobacteria bacterium]